MFARDLGVPYNLYTCISTLPYLHDAIVTMKLQVLTIAGLIQKTFYLDPPTRGTLLKRFRRTSSPIPRRDQLYPWYKTILWETKDQKRKKRFLGWRRWLREYSLGQWRVWQGDVTVHLRTVYALLCDEKSNSGNCSLEKWAVTAFRLCTAVLIFAINRVDCEKLDPGGMTGCERGLTS